MNIIHSSARHGARKIIVPLAFAAVYKICGSTYLAIRVAVGDVPAFMMTGIRFTIAGANFVPNSFGPAQAMADELGTPRCDPANVLTDDRYFDNLPSSMRTNVLPVACARREGRFGIT